MFAQKANTHWTCQKFLVVSNINDQCHTWSMTHRDSSWVAWHKTFFWDKANPKTLKRAKEMKKIIKKSFVRRSTFKKGSCKKKKNECHYTFCCFHGFVPDVIYPCAAMNDVTLRILTFGTRNLVHKVRPLLLLLTTSEFWNYIKRSLKICFKLWSRI